MYQGAKLPRLTESIREFCALNIFQLYKLFLIHPGVKLKVAI